MYGMCFYIIALYFVFIQFNRTAAIWGHAIFL